MLLENRMRSPTEDESLYAATAKMQAAMQGPQRLREQKTSSRETPNAGHRSGAALRDLRKAGSEQIAAGAVRNRRELGFMRDANYCGPGTKEKIVARKSDAINPICAPARTKYRRNPISDKELNTIDILVCNPVRLEWQSGS